MAYCYSRRSVASVVLLILATFTDASPKRGLCFVPNEDHPSDNDIWTQPDASLTWYYNYQSRPSPAYSSIPQSDFEFVPMMWGVDAEDPDSTSFLDDVLGLIDDGVNITHVLGFNEPDGPLDTGGSNILPEVAAKAWVANFEPLAAKGVKLGLPGCTGGWGGLPWLHEFLGNCSEILREDDGEKKNCTWDFLPVHWYDNFEGLASHVGERQAAFPGVEIWVTEYAYAHQDLATAQAFFNQSASYLDESKDVARYSYFGAFRSEVSNVGPDVVFLNNDGEVTDIGAWYTGLEAKGVEPQSSMGGEALISRWLLGSIAAALVTIV